MVKKFEFKQNDTELDFEGVKFYIDVTNPEVIERILKFSEAAQKQAENTKTDGNYLEELREVISLGLTSIDSILGEGASDKIFEGRRVGLLDVLDVLNFIQATVKEIREEKFKQYSPNRATRRAKK